MLCSKGCYISVQAGTTPCYDSDSVVGVRHGGSMARKGVMKDRLPQIVSVTAQVAISRTPAPSPLGDCTGRYFEKGVALQTPA